MPIYYYKARNKNGEYLEGLMDSASSESVAQILLSKKLAILEISLKPKNSYTFILNKLLFKRVSSKDLVIFFRQISVMLDANLPLVKALKILSVQAENKTLKNIIVGLADEIDGGSPLSSAMAFYPEVFSGFYVNIVHSGETSGRLSEVMNYLADQKEKDYELQSKIKSAMIYPVFVLVLLLAVSFIVMTFVIPGITETLAESGAELPLITRVLIAMSSFLRDFWWLVISLVFLLSFFVVFWSKTDSGKRIIDIVKLKIPIFGGIYKNIYIVRICLSFATLIRGGVPIATSLGIVKDVVDNSVYADILAKAMASVDEGNSISEAFSNNSYIPIVVPQMMEVGEESGKLDEVLTKVSDFYTKEIDNTVRNLSVLLEPFIMLVLGLGVGLFIAAVILPMWQLSSSF